MLETQRGLMTLYYSYYIYFCCDYSMIMGLLGFLWIKIYILFNEKHSMYINMQIRFLLAYIISTKTLHLANRGYICTVMFRIQNTFIRESMFFVVFPLYFKVQVFSSI